MKQGSILLSTSVEVTIVITIIGTVIAAYNGLSSKLDAHEGQDQKVSQQQATDVANISNITNSLNMLNANVNQLLWAQGLKPVKAP